MKKVFIIIIILFSSFTNAQNEKLNWFSPYPQGNTLNQVTTAGDAYFAVGANCTIIKSTDIGDNWIVKNNLLNKSNDLVSCSFPTPTSGWAAGASGLILHTTDSGETWAGDSIADADLNSIQFIDTLFGWVCGDNGAFLLTVNGGNSWNKISFPEDHLLLEVNFIDKNTGWLVLQLPTGYYEILNSTDGGNTWFAQYKDWYSISSLRFFDKLHGKACTRLYNQLLTTEDGGITWNKIETSGADDFFVQTIFFYNKDSAYASGRNSMFKTTDGGISWEHVSAPYGSDINSIFLKSFGQGIAVGNSGKIERILNESIWRMIGDFYDYDFYSIDFSSNDEGWMIGRKIKTYDPIKSFILNSSDGGNVWTVKYMKIKARLEKIKFIDSNIGIAIGNRIIRTTDNGLNWNEVQPDTNFLLYGIDNFGSNVWCAGLEGKILKSSDYGSTWQYKNSGVTWGLYDVGFSSENTGYICGAEGHILKSSDGGDTWFSLNTLITESLYKLYFIDDSTGWCAGNSIYFTSDGGSSWETQYYGETPIKDIVFTSAENGYAAGFEGTYITTSDGGEKWIKQPKISNSTFNDITISGDSNLWFCGLNGVLMGTKIPVILGVFTDDAQVINSFLLLQNYPNPFNPLTVIRYSLPSSVNVSLKIYDILGKEVETLINKKQAAGNYKVEFNGAGLASGVYIYRLQAGGFTSTKKMILLR